MEPIAEIEEAVPEPRSKRDATFWGPIGFVVGYALAIHLITTYPIEISRDKGYWSQALGAIVLSKTLLCATWAAWDRNHIVWRLPIGVSILTFLYLLQWWPLGQLHDPLGHAIRFMFLFGLFSIVRLMIGLQFATTAGTSASLSSNRFSMRYLFGWMTVAALLFAFADYVRGDIADARFVPRWIPTIKDVAWNCLGMLRVLPVAACICYVMRRRMRYYAIFPLAVVGGAITVMLSIAYYWCRFESIPWKSGLMLQHMWHAIGAMATALVFAFVLRSAGYRCVRFKSAT